MISKIRKGFNLLQNLRSLLTVGAILIYGVAFSQSGETVDSSKFVTGIVRDAKTKAPIAAAQIVTLVKRAAATTGEDGTFKINVTYNSEVLIVKAYNYGTVEVPVKGRTNLEIDLYSEYFSEYYTIGENITGVNRSSSAVNSVKTINTVKNSTVVSVDEMIGTSLQGSDVRASNKSGVGGIGTTLFIRGLNSVNLNAQPLYVVDGVIWSNCNELTSLHNGFFINPIDNINLNDIESVSVIKDGTSIYGSKGSNGVILIKTKRGRDLATKITVNMAGGVVQTPKSFPVMNGNQFKTYTTDLLGTTGFTLDEIAAQDYLNDDPSQSTYKTYHNSTKWEDEIYQLGKYQSYNINVTGGDERALYAFSVGYTGNKGIVNTTEMKRLNTRFNADFALSNIVDMGLNIGFSNVDRKLLDDGVSFYTSPTYLALIKAEFLNPNTYTSSGTLTTDYEDADVFGTGNPNAIIGKALNASKHYRLNLGLKPVIHITPALSISNYFDYSLFKVKESFFKPMVGSADMYIEGYGMSENTFRNQLIQNFNFFNDLAANYKLSKQNHQLTAMLGARYFAENYTTDYAEGHNTGSDEKRNLLTEEEFKHVSGLNNRTKSLSYYANAQYSYAERYFLTATASVDGSSRFGSETEDGFQLFDYTWAMFPSVNAAWLISSETFMKNIPVDLLKLRVGAGRTGNDAFAPYASSAYFSPIQYMDRANGLILSNVGNTKIQWETTNKLNVGIDLNLFKNRLSLTADVYKNTTTDLLHLNPLPEIAGDGYYWANGGELTNKGYEISANVKMLNTKWVKWEVGASIGHYNNKIESLPDGSFVTSIYDADILTATGYSAGVFYGYKTNGVFKTAADAQAANLKIIDASGNTKYFEAGDMHFTDVNNDGIINESDRQVIGNPNPDIYGSFNTKIIVGDVTISALFTFSYGNDVYNYLRSQLESGNSFKNQSTAMLNRWTYEGQETDMPKVTYGDPMGNARFSDRWIEDGSYLKFKSLSVSYKVPVKIKFIDQVDVWMSATNILTLTNYLGRDPEVSAGNSVLYQGIDNGLIPNTRSFYIGVNLNL